MVHFSLYVIFDVEKFFNCRISEFVRSSDEIRLVYDDKLEMPALSLLDYDGIPCIIGNPNLIPKDENLQAHILSHEMGHIINKDIYIDPRTLKRYELYEKECLADEVASEYINKSTKYNKDIIIEYLKNLCINEVDFLDKRLKYINELIQTSYETEDINKINFINEELNFLRYRIHNYKDDAITRINILNNIII